MVNTVLGITHDGAGNLTAVGGLTITDDGEGRRGKKGPVVMVYDAFGRLAAEYGGAAEAVGTEYLTTDHLGSTRVVTDTSGAVRRRLDYLPFGEQMTQGMGGRGACYASATEPRMKFTGKEWDGETGLEPVSIPECNFATDSRGRV